jgi:hypothetical protein
LARQVIAVSAKCLSVKCFSIKRRGTLQLMFSCFSSRLIPSFSTAQLSLLTWKNKIGCEKKKTGRVPQPANGEWMRIQSSITLCSHHSQEEMKKSAGWSRPVSRLSYFASKKMTFLPVPIPPNGCYMCFSFVLNGEWAVAILPCTLNSKASFDKKNNSQRTGKASFQPVTSLAGRFEARKSLCHSKASLNPGRLTKG